jgi:hypothetical protein
MKITQHCTTRFAERVLGLPGDQVQAASQDQAKAETLRRLALAAARRALQAAQTRERNGYVRCVDPGTRVAFVLNPRLDTAVTCYLATDVQVERISRSQAA